jgi:hypothetical protein
MYELFQFGLQMYISLLINEYNNSSLLATTRSHLGVAIVSTSSMYTYI